jgi:hypothetical protein
LANGRRFFLTNKTAAMHTIKTTCFFGVCFVVRFCARTEVLCQAEGSLAVRNRKVQNLPRGIITITISSSRVAVLIISRK